MAKEETRKADLEEVLIASRATDEDLEAGLLNSSSIGIDSQGKPIEPQKQRSSVKKNVSELGQRVRKSFNGQSETPPLPPSLALAPVPPPMSAHPPLPKSAMKKAGEQLYKGVCSLDQPLHQQQRRTLDPHSGLAVFPCEPYTQGSVLLPCRFSTGAQQ